MLNLFKVTVNILQKKIFQINAVRLILLFIKKKSRFHKNIKQHNCFQHWWYWKE